jgi:hypothetical protein
MVVRADHEITTIQFFCLCQWRTLACLWGAFPMEPLWGGDREFSAMSVRSSVQSVSLQDTPSRYAFKGKGGGKGRGKVGVIISLVL